jgi:hypothetical protein
LLVALLTLILILRTQSIFFEEVGDALIKGCLKSHAESHEWVVSDGLVLATVAGDDGLLHAYTS